MIPRLFFNGCAIAALVMLLAVLPTPSFAQLLFEDVTATYQLDDSGIETNMFWYDYDNDGDQDLLCTHRFSATSYLYRNDGDRFTGLTSIGLPTNFDGGKTIPMDFDHDGDLDLFVASYNNASAMLVSEDGIFVNRTAQLGLPYLAVARDYQWVDFDRDGWMDLLYCDAIDGFHLYRNVNGESFLDVTASTQLPPLNDFGRTCEADFDLDGDVDIFMTRFNGDDHFYLNLGNGIFEDRTISAGLLDADGRGGCEWVDIDHDKYPDLLTQGPQRHAIWHNNADGTFTEMNVHGTATNFDVAHLYGGYYSVADFDMDGDDDFYFDRLETGGVEGRPNQLFIQDSLRGLDIWFHDAAAANGMAFEANTQSCVADFDGDGALDIFVSVAEAQGHLFRNTSHSAVSALQVQVLGPNGERDRWHTRVELYPHGSFTALGVSELNTSNVSRNGFDNYFVVDGSAHYDLRIYFVSGAAMLPQDYPQLSDIVPSDVNHRLTVRMGQQMSGAKPTVTAPQAFALMTAYPNPFNPSTTIRYSLASAGKVRLAVYNVEGRLVKELVQGNLAAGEHEVTWNAGAEASGIYIVDLSTGAEHARQKVMLLK